MVKRSERARRFFMSLYAFCAALAPPVSAVCAAGALLVLAIVAAGLTLRQRAAKAQ